MPLQVCAFGYVLPHREGARSLLDVLLTPKNGHFEVLASDLLDPSLSSSGMSDLICSIRRGTILIAMLCPTSVNIPYETLRDLWVGEAVHATGSSLYKALSTDTVYQTSLSKYKGALSAQRSLERSIEDMFDPQPAFMSDDYDTEAYAELASRWESLSGEERLGYTEGSSEVVGRSDFLKKSASKSRKFLNMQKDRFYSELRESVARYEETMFQARKKEKIRKERGQRSE